MNDVRAKVPEEVNNLLQPLRLTPRFRTFQVCPKDLPAVSWQAERGEGRPTRGLYLPTLAALKKRGSPYSR
jgi:hypothetical protein